MHTFADGDQNVIPFANSWEEDGTLPHSLYRKAAADGLLMPMAAGKSIPDEWRGKFPIMGGVDPAEWDGFHDFIIHSELNRVGGVGVQNGLTGGVTLCMPAVLNFGSKELRTRISNDILSGTKRMCLAVTEPDAGSDVASISTEAVLSPDGKHYIVNGRKKWITSGMYADYFLTLTKTSDDGMTVLVIPKSEGVTVRRMKMQGSGSAGTAFVEFDDALVPVGNVLGTVGNGLKSIMSNFNHEVWFRRHHALFDTLLPIFSDYSYLSNL
ncbi:hypothetical protein NX059_010076 [Plenodomus lindquistii]|nr:hypothetical protein NX059_010076 [Plenodomus lindquistii]